MAIKSSVNILLNRWMINTVENITICLVAIADYFRPITKVVINRMLLKNGIRVNGDDPWDIQVKNEIFSAMVICKAASGLSEAIIEDIIDCNDFEEFMFRNLRPPNNIIYALNYYHPYLNAKSLIHKVFDAQTEENTTNTVGSHYDEDLKTESFEDFLDKTMQYSTILFTSEESINVKDDSQLLRVMEEGANRMRELLARKLKLEPGMKVLDIGCGIGGLAKYLAENYKVHVTGVSVSQDMANRAREVCKGLDVTIHGINYREIRGKFDRIVSVEMFEHVGEHHHREYFENVSKWLVDDGIFVLNTICVNHAHFSSYEPAVEVFANFYSWMPRPENIILHSKGLFIIEDWQNFGYQFGLTCRVMLKRMRNNMSYFEKKYSRRKIRKLTAYAATGSAGGRSKKTQVYSVVFSKSGLPYQYSY